MLKTTIVRPPAIAEIPEWVKEACVGLKLRLSQGGEGENDGHIFNRFRFQILPDTLIELLKTQRPQPRSLEASDWMSHSFYWGGGIGLLADCLQDPLPVSKWNFLEFGLEDKKNWYEIFDAIIEALGPDFGSYNISFEPRIKQEEVRLIFSNGPDKSKHKRVLIRNMHVIEASVAENWLRHRASKG